MTTAPAAQDFQFAPVTLEAAESHANASPEDRARWRDAMMGVTGGDQKKVDAYEAELRGFLTKTVTHPGEPLAGTETGQPAANFDLTSGIDAAITPEQKEAGAALLRRHWTGSREELEARLKEEGIGPEKTADPRSNLAREFDAAAAGLLPQNYKLNGVFVNRSFTQDEALTLSGEMRSLLAATQTPGAAASSIAVEWADNIEAERGKADWTPERLELWWRSERLNASNALRMDYEAITLLAKAAIARADQKTILSLAKKGAFNSGAAMARLAQSELVRRARG